MKNLKHLFTALLLLYVSMAFAEEVTINGITYDVVTKAKVATVIAKEIGNYSGSVVIPETPKCATPALSYNNGKLVIYCETEGAEFVTDVTCGDIQRFYDSEINFSATYNISVYAIATGYKNSETVNAALCWIENGNIDNETNVINIPATAVFITSRNGELSINCALDGESVEVYTTGGALVGTTTIANGNATIQTALSKGSKAIVKIGDKSVKVIVD